MFDAITLDAVRLFRDFTTTKLAELLAAVNAKATEVLTAISGTGIKSIQRGVISISSSNLTATVTVSAVNMSKAELRILGGKVTDIGQMPMAVLDSSTTITASRGGTGGGFTSTVSWELTEWK